MNEEYTIEEQIAECLKTASTLDPASKEYKEVIDRVNTLHNLLNNRDKIQNEAEARQQEIDLETEKINLEKERLKHEKKKSKKDRKAKEKEIESEIKKTRMEAIATGLVGGLGLLGTCLGIKATKKMHRDTLEFEKTGTVRSSTKSFWKRWF